MHLQDSPLSTMNLDIGYSYTGNFTSSSKHQCSQIVLPGKVIEMQGFGLHLDLLNLKL